jgi:hypothetical protein
MGAKHSRFAVALLAIVMAVSVHSRVIGNELGDPSARNSSPRVATLTIPGKTMLVSFVRQLVGAYVLARFVANLGHPHTSDRSEFEVSKKQAVLVSKAEASSVASAGPVLK